MKIALWVFPPEDFDGWCELVGSPEVADYAGYLALISSIQADQERQGREVARVRFTVAEMKGELAARELANTPDNRACITGLRGDHFA